MADLMDGDVAPGPALAGCVRQRGRPFLLHFPLAFELGNRGTNECLTNVIADL